MKHTLKIIQSVLFLLTTLLAVACNSQQNSPLQPLTADQIKNLLTENTLVSAGLNKGDKGYWAVYYLNNGNERGVSGNSFDSGKWRTHEGSLCSDWKTWSKEERCFQLFRNTRGQIVAFYEGKESFKAVVEAGNSRGL